MRLFGKVDGTIDRYDRADWLSMPFDLAFGSAATLVYGPLSLSAYEIHIPGPSAIETFSIGISAIELMPTPAASHIEAVPR